MISRKGYVPDKVSSLSLSLSLSSLMMLLILSRNVQIDLLGLSLFVKYCHLQLTNSSNAFLQIEVDSHLVDLVVDLVDVVVEAEVRYNK